MSATSCRAFAVVILSAAVLMLGPASDITRADDKHQSRKAGDHDDALKARQDGAVLPFPEVLAMVRPDIDGEIIEIEFEYEDGVAVYEFKYVDRRGRVRERYVDARTGAVLKDKPD
ncbi:MAG: PepSY domain-containing protein [Alphaproteobacteria bacterium]|jgi:uncharacterized membrane protein YkoI|nr:PepSY domain-containing protein [Alphaproteobacteria bacterium]